MVYGGSLKRHETKCFEIRKKILFLLHVYS
jgi:hypothetical protein